MEQHQAQAVNIASAEHGMTDEVRCAYVDWVMASMPSWQKRMAMQEKFIKVLFFKGKVQRVFCHHIIDGNCASSLNAHRQRRCFMLDST
jgi:hypothetical protein